MCTPLCDTSLEGGGLQHSNDVCGIVAKRKDAEHTLHFWTYKNMCIYERGVLSQVAWPGNKMVTKNTGGGHWSSPTLDLTDTGAGVADAQARSMKQQ